MAIFAVTGPKSSYNTDEASMILNKIKPSIETLYAYYTFVRIDCALHSLAAPESGYAQDDDCI